jgi:hypothetical protein
VTSTSSCAGPRSAAAALLVAAACFVLPAGARAQTQPDPQELLEQPLPGAAQGTTADTVAGEFECQRRAEDQGLAVRQVVESRTAGADDQEVTLSVDASDGRYDALCIYDNAGGQIRDLKPVEAAAAPVGSEASVDDEMVRRARRACADMAQNRNLSAVAMEDPRGRDARIVEIGMRAMVDGDRREVTCLYEDDRNRALLAR